MLKNIHLLTYANGFSRITKNEYAISQKLLVDTISLSTKYNVVFHTYNFENVKNKNWFSKISDLPNFKYKQYLPNIQSHTDWSRGGYYNSWKPFLIKEVYDLMGADDVLYYVDSSGYYQTGFIENIDNLIEYTYKNDRVCGSFGSDVRNNSYNCCDDLNVWKFLYGNLYENFEVLLTKPHILNSWVLFKKEFLNTKFINEWVNLTEKKLKNIPLICHHHTVDQSLFNILCYKYNFNSFFNYEPHDLNKNHNNVHNIINNKISNGNDISQLFKNPKNI